MQTNAAVVCYDSHATGTGNGTSWADAYTDLQTAVTAAGDGGEVRVRQGVHYPVASAATSITIGNVKLIGGYTGNGDERSTNRRLTVFTGDFNKDDRYVDQNNAEIGKIYDPDTDALIEFRDWTAEEKYWKIDTAKRSDNVAQLFKASSGAQHLEGLTFIGFGSNSSRGAIYTGVASSALTLTNCDFVASCCAGANGPANIEPYASTKVLDCGFYGSMGCNFHVYTTGSGIEVRGCVFRCLYGKAKNLRSVGVALPAGMTGSVADSQFEWVYFGTGGAANWGTVLSTTSTGKFSSIDRCAFRHISVDTLDGTVNAPLIKLSQNMTDVPVNGCEFSDCSMILPIPVALFGGSFKDCRFARNLLKVGSETATASAQLTNGNSLDCEFEDNTVEVMTSGEACLAGGSFSRTYAGAISRNIVTNSLTGNARLCKSCDDLTDVQVQNNVVAAPLGKTACLISGKTGGAWRTSVVGNTVVGGSGLAAIVHGSGAWVNSTIAQNRIVGSGSEAKAATFYHTDDLILVHCVVLNNEAPYEAYGYTTSAKSRLLLFNSILWRADSDYIAYAAEYPATLDAAKHGLVIRSSAFKGVLADHSEICAYDGYRPVGLLTELGDPLFASTPRTLQDGRKYFILSSKSPYAKVATQILNVKSAACIFKHQDNNQWYDFLSANSGTGMGWSRYLDGKTLTGEEINLPDLQGNERPDTKIAFGVTQELVKPGLMLLLR